MDENTNKAVFNLMQKVVDKLDHISDQLNSKNEAELNNTITEENGELKKLIMFSIKNQERLKEENSETTNKIISLINNNPPVTNNHTTYSLIGNKPYFKPWGILIIILSSITLWSSIKYIPPYLSEESTLKKEHEEYQTFYNYVLLKQQKHKIPNAQKTLRTIKNKDTMFMKEYYLLLNNYKKEVRKKQLEKELKSLEKNDS